MGCKAGHYIFHYNGKFQSAFDARKTEPIVSPYKAFLSIPVSVDAYGCRILKPMLEIESSCNDGRWTMLGVNTKTLIPDHVPLNPFLRAAVGK